MSYNIANRYMPRVQDMIDDLPNSHKQSVEDALDGLERDPFDPRNPAQSIDSVRYKIYAANGDLEIVFEMPISSNRINIEIIRPRSRANKLLRAIKKALEFYPQGAAPN